MTPQESSMLEDLIRKIEETQLTEKDPDAEQLLRQGLGRDPDAIYKLAQTVLVQNLALNQARAQIRQMQQTQQQTQPARSTSFLGSLLGHRDPAPPAPQPPENTAAPAYGVPASSPAGSFLRSAATTAAGVAAGALAFEGIESLIHGFGHGEGGFGSGAPRVEETVINNYYDDPQQARGFGEQREASSDDDRPESESGLEDTTDDPDTDSASLDDTQTDDSDSDFGDGDDSNFS